MGELIESVTKEGALVDTGGLAPRKDGFRVRVQNGMVDTTHWPFIESKKIIGDWALLEADSKAEIQRFTNEFMRLHWTHWPGFEGECEVRPIGFQEQPHESRFKAKGSER